MHSKNKSMKNFENYVMKINSFSRGGCAFGHGWPGCFVRAGDVLGRVFPAFLVWEVFSLALIPKSGRRFAVRAAGGKAAQDSRANASHFAPRFGRTTRGRAQHPMKLPQLFVY